MLDKLIYEKASLVSYSQEELSNIASTSNHLRSIINNQPDFNDSFIGGSYKRATMVKGVSDVDVYYQYTGIGNPQTALARLRTCLINSYPKSEIIQDSPSIVVNFERIPFNITPYKKDSWNNVFLPDDYLISWQRINFGELENAIIELRRRNSNLIELIKILKLWNFNYNRGLKNYRIEYLICNKYLYSPPFTPVISDWLYNFFSNNRFTIDANRFYSIIQIAFDESKLKSEWLKFIDNRS